MPVTNVKTKWSSGNLQFLDSSGNVIATWDGTNRKLVFPNGAKIDIESGGKITADGTQASHIADAKTDYTAGDLDTEAEIIAAFNTTNTKINAILAALEGVGILATS